MDNRKTVVAALVLGFGVLAAIPAQAQTQMDEGCVRAVENEVRERYPQALGVEVAALDGHELSDLETGFSGAGQFEDEDGDRTTFSFDCISNARTGQAYGVTLSGATPQPRSSAARPARRGPLSALIAAIANRGQQGSRDASANEAPAAARQGGGDRRTAA